MSASFWDERYRAAEYAYGREPNDFLVDTAALFPSGRILCLADGEGRNGTFLAERGYSVTSVDFSREALRKAERLACERNVSLDLVHADLAEWTPEDGAYSGVVSIFCHLPPPVRRRVHGLVGHALRPGGVLVLEAYAPAQLALGTGGPKDPALLASREVLESELAGLEIQLAWERERVVQEGPFHAGPSAVVQLVARKAPIHA